MEGNLEKNYYKVGVAGNDITPEDIHECLEANLDGMFVISKMTEEENQAIKEMRESESPCKQQPTVPIQFVFCDGLVYAVDDVNTNGLRFRGSDVEQIGAVLYVKGE